MVQYLNRYLDDIIEKRLKMINAIVIIGPKWVGKTTTAKRHAKDIINLQDPDYIDSYKELAYFKPSKLLEGEKPLLIDEWQNIPKLWDAIRTRLDKIDNDEKYILTGSTAIDESKIMHSGTGRFNRIIMRPMSLYESNESNGKISFLDLFKNPDMDIDGIKSELSIEDLIFAACRGGWPESLNKDNIEAQLFVVQNYIENISNIDVSGIDNVKRDPKRVEAILKAYSRNVCTLASDKTLLKDIKAKFPKMTHITYKEYLNALSRLFVIDEIDSWSPNIRSASAIRQKNKRAFIDPSIAVACLNLNPENLLFDLKTFGFIFENLCIRDLKVYSYAEGGEVSYYRDKTGLESDCVIHLKNGDYALIEFRLGRNKIDEGASNLIKLNNLIEKAIKEDKVKMRKPKFLAVITGTELAYTRKDGVKVLPIGCLR